MTDHNPAPQPNMTALHDAARASFSAAKAGPLNARQSARLAAVASGVVSGLVDRAQAAAVASIAPAADDAGAALWSDVLAMLAYDDLSPVLYCRKTGRRLGLVQPDGWRDYLTAIAAMGDSRAADVALCNLIAAIQAQLAHTVAPVVLVSSSASLALIRETSPADYMAIAMGEIFPLPRGAQSLEQAQRNQRLGHARDAMQSLPPAALQYACETVGLFLAYVKPRLLPPDLDLLGAYGAGAQADIAAPFLSVASLGHFCGRLVQLMVRLIGQATLKPVDKLTARDLASLRVHYQGDNRYSSSRQMRREIRAAKAAKARLQRLPVILDKRAQTHLAGIDSGLLSDLGASLILDALDLSFASGAMGRNLPVRLETETQADIALARQAELRALQAAGDDAAETLDLLDLSGLLLSGALPDDMLPTIESEADLASMGLDFDALGLDDWQEDDPEDLPDDAEAVLPAWLQDFAIGQAKPSRPAKPAKPAKPDRYADAMALASQFGLTGSDPAPVRRAIPSGPVPGVSPATTAPSTASPVRRVIR